MRHRRVKGDPRRVVWSVSPVRARERGGKDRTPLVHSLWHFNPRSCINCQTDDGRRRRCSRSRRVHPVRPQRTPRSRRRVRTTDIEPTTWFDVRASPHSSSRTHWQALRGAGRRACAPKCRAVRSRRTSFDHRRVRCAVPASPSSALDPSPDYPTHHAGPVDSHGACAAGLYARRHRSTCPSARRPSTIDPEHGRKRRRHRRCAARPAFDRASCTRWWRCGCTSTSTSARAAAAAGGSAVAGWRRIRCPRSTDRAHATGGGARPRSRGARWSRTRSMARLRFLCAL